MFHCDVCLRPVRFKHDLAKHLRKMHRIGAPAKPATSTAMLCDHCPFVPKGIARSVMVIHIFRRHMSSSAGAAALRSQDNRYRRSQESLLCDACGRGYSGKRTMETHLVLAHDVEADRRRRYDCDECGLSYRGDPLSLHQHWRRAHAGLVGRHNGSALVDCDDCGDRLPRSAMAWHQRAKHRRRLLFVSQLSRDELRRHRKPKKKKKKDFDGAVCDECGQSWGSLDSLRACAQPHWLREHSGRIAWVHGLAPLTCDECGKEVPKNHMSNHLRIKHRLDLPFRA